MCMYRQAQSELCNVDVLSTLPGSGHGYRTHRLSERLSRLFTVLSVFVPSTDVIRTIFTRRVSHWLEEFPTYSVDHLPEFAQVGETLITSKSNTLRKLVVVHSFLF